MESALAFVLLNAVLLTYLHRFIDHSDVYNCLSK